MSLLEKIVYLADYIEVRRGEREELEEIRRIAFSDLDTAVYKTLQATIQYVEKKGQAMCSLSLEALQYYRDLLEKGEDVQ